MKRIQLIEIAHAKSGDKGNSANIAVIARNPKYYAILEKYVTEIVVKDHFKDVCDGAVIRYALPKIFSLNFILENALGGGGTSSLRLDALGKALGDALLMMYIDVPKEVFEIESYSRN